MMQTTIKIIHLPINSEIKISYVIYNILKWRAIFNFHSVPSKDKYRKVKFFLCKEYLREGVEFKRRIKFLFIESYNE